MIKVDNDILKEVNWFLTEGSLVKLMKEKQLSFPAQCFILLHLGEDINKAEAENNK